MAEFLTAEQLLGLGASAAAPTKTAAPAQGWVSAQDLLGVPEERTFLGDVKGFLGEKAGEVGPAAKSLAEFVTAGPGMLVGAVAGAGRAAEQMLKGKPRREALEAGLETSGRVGQALNPVAVATKLLGYEPEPTVIEHVMEKISKAIHHYGEKVEVGTNRALMAEDVDLFAQLLMGAGMGKATQKAIEAGVKKATEPAKPGTSMDDMVAKPAEAPALDAPVQSVGELLVIEKAKQVKELFKKAKARGAPMPLDVTPEALGNLFDRARAGTLPAREAPQAPLTPGQAVEQSKTRIAEGLTLEEARAKIDAESAPPTDLALAIEKVRGGRAFDLTAAEKISLDNSLKVKSGVLLDHNGRAFERGSVDPDLLKGILAAGGVAAFVAMNPDKAEEVAAIASGVALTMKGKPEAALLESLRKGGKEAELAATELYTRTHKQVERTLRAQPWAKHVSIEEAVNDGMYSAIKSVVDGSFRGDSKFSTYATTAVLNRGKNQVRDSLDQMKDVSINEKAADGTDFADTLGHQNTPERAALTRVLGDRINEAMEKIDPKFKEAFLAVEAEGLSYAEAAERFGVPEGTIRSRISRAKDALQAQLRDYRDGEVGATEQHLGGATGRLGKGEGGAVDPRMLGALAAVSGGAAIGGLLDPEHPIRNAVYGALAGGVLGTGAGRGALKAAIASPDLALGLISTRLGNIAPELKFKLRAHELNVLKAVDAANDAALPFIHALQKLPKELHQRAARALLNGDTATIESLPGLRATYPAVQKILGSLESQLQGLGRFGEGVSDYFPRLVKDFEGLKAAIGQEAKIGIEKRLIEEEAKMIRKKGRSLTDVEQSIIVNNYLFAPDQGSFQKGFTKGRKIQEVPEQLQQFYEPPTESLLRYLSGAVNDIEVARFFGRDLATKGKRKTFTDLDSSIGNLTARLLNEKQITQAQAMELRNVLKARFEGGEKGMSTPLAAVRNLTNTGLLGNVASAATQIGDSFSTIYHHGLVPTLQAVTEKIIGRERVNPKQLGLINHVAEELSEMGATGRALHVAMKYSGFKAIDMFAKGIGLNAALIKNQRQVATPEGAAAFRAKYQAAFGERTDAVIADLKAGRRSPETDQLAFSELSDAQPISKAEMPEMYLRHPNGRLLYQLKTYMLKQTDIIRRDAYQEIAKGTPEGIMRGSKNLAALATVYALANVPGDVVKDILAGREVDPFTTPKLVENVFQTFGINRYAGQQLGQGKVVETAIGLATPPVRVLQDIAKLDAKSGSYVPLVGRPLYERFGGGNEKREIYERQFSAKGDKKPLSPAAKAYLREKRLAAKAKEKAR